MLSNPKASAAIAHEPIIAILLALYVLCFIAPRSVRASDKMQFASLVEKFEKGYLISIVPREPGIGSYMNMRTVDPDAWPSKYIKAFESPNRRNYILPVEKRDEHYVAEQCHWDLSEKLIIYDDQGFHAVVEGDKFYVKLFPLGPTTHIEDICVFVKSSPDFEKLNLVWAKKYETGDETYKRVLGNDRLINDWRNFLLGPSPKDLLRKVAAIIQDYSSQSRKSIVDNSVLAVDRSNIDLFETRIYELNLSTSAKSYIVENNIESVADQIFFNLGLLLDDKADQKQVIEFNLWKQYSMEGFWFHPEFKIDHIFTSTKYKKDFVIFHSNTNASQSMYILFEREGETAVMRMAPRKTGI